MKQKIICVCLVLLSIGLFSCSQDDEIFSCNRDVNAWVKENLADIRTMSRTDWLNLDQNVNRAAYVAFTPEQKHLFWKGKISEVLKLDWNEAEKRHIELLYETISNNPQWFFDDFSKNEEEWEKFELFTYRWIEDAKDNLGWDKKLIGSIIAFGNKLLNKEGELQTNKNSTVRLKGRGEENCECSQSSSWCGNQSSCESDVCKEHFGCGTLWLYYCNGGCMIEIYPTN